MTQLRLVIDADIEDDAIAQELVENDEKGTVTAQTLRGWLRTESVSVTEFYVVEDPE